MSLEQEQQIVFGPFRLDPITTQLWQGEQGVALQSKPLAVLHYLAQRPGQLVTKQELLKNIWTGVYVTKAVLKTCVQAIRKALGDEVTAPRYIETVGREGYRFIAQEQGSTVTVQGAASELALSPQPPVPILVGRETELAHLHDCLRKALDGQPQLVFVTGEPGIGKTTVVDLFHAQVQAAGHVTIGYGQCIEQYGEGEAYLPVLEAMSRLCREEDGQQFSALLRKHAPTWLVQLPGISDEGELQALRLQVQGATRERMLREMAEAIEVGTVRRPLVLILEDLHWSDHATIELLAYLAKRRQRARLLVVATYRPVDVLLGRHSLKDVKQELQAHGQCEERRIELLTTQDVNTYVTERFGAQPQMVKLATQIHRRTEGNALFMVNVVEDLVHQGTVVHEQGQWYVKGDAQLLGTPESLQQLIGRQVERLSAEVQRVLEVASVVGAEFAVAAVAAGLRKDAEEIEDICEQVAWQGHFLEERGIAEWPDGTVSGRYAFRHALYQNVLYQRIAEARRIRLHRQIGERIEAGYGEQAKEIAAELAVQFERGRDIPRAIQYLQHAGQNAVRRSAHQEAIVHLTKGLALLKTLPDTAERTQQELRLQVTLSVVLMTTKGYAAPEVEQAFTRARELCRQVGETPELFHVLGGLWAFYWTRAELKPARELVEQLFSLAQRVQDPVFLLLAHHTLGDTLFFLGELAAARTHAEQCLALYDPQQHRSLGFRFGLDPGVGSGSHVALTLWLLGYPDQALQRSHAALSLSQDLAHLYSRAIALGWAAFLSQHCRDEHAAQAQAQAAIALSTEHGFTSYLAWGTILGGWALAAQARGAEGITQLRRGLAIYQATGQKVYWPGFLALLAEACGKEGQPEEGLIVVAEALIEVNKTGQRWCEAELYRLKGQLTLQKFQVSSPQFQVSAKQKTKNKGQKANVFNTQAETESEACFHKAIDIARQQQAKSLELRAVMSLSRLWQTQGKQQEAHEMLAETYNWFTEGFDTKDLQEAKALLDELGSP